MFFRSISTLFKQKKIGHFNRTIGIISGAAPKPPLDCSTDRIYLLLGAGSEKPIHNNDHT